MWHIKRARRPTHVFSRLDDLLEVTVDGARQHLLYLLLVSMSQALMLEEDFLLGDDEVLISLAGDAHKDVHLVGVG
jgi:hypothetical protein